MYNVTLRRLHATTLSVEEQKVLHASVRACLPLCVFLGDGVDIQARSCACLRVALLTQDATYMRHIICVLSGSTMFFEIVS